MIELSPLGIAYFTALAIILGGSLVNLGVLIRPCATQDRHGRYLVTSIALAILLFAFGIVSGLPHLIFLVFAPRATWSILAAVGAAAFPIAAVMILVRIQNWMTVALMTLGTGLIMQGARLVLFVEGSRYEYSGTPWVDWTIQLLMLTISAASIGRLGLLHHNQRRIPQVYETVNARDRV